MQDELALVVALPFDHRACHRHPVRVVVGELLCTPCLCAIAGEQTPDLARRLLIPLSRFPTPLVAHEVSPPLAWPDGGAAPRGDSGRADVLLRLRRRRGVVERGDRVVAGAEDREDLVQAGDLE